MLRLYCKGKTSYIYASEIVSIEIFSPPKELAATQTPDANIYGIVVSLKGKENISLGYCKTEYSDFEKNTKYIDKFYEKGCR